ncbi:hypothetical protein C8J57DRAFT_1713757 [Mycena rebaudengoi]|nr:hypothetical protein C8J57DRAFT_1713757 [Mycena rebaudengoi]
MAPRKPTWDWKARGCAEFQHFTVAFAVKEYVQNVVGQILKDLRVREWSDWEREDLRASLDVPVKQRETRKQFIIANYPGLLTGPHGAVLKRAKAWLPSYILSATIPQSRLPMSNTDLKIAIVVWKHNTVDTIALSFYNNHLDKRATFSSFTVDGSSTSRDNYFAYLVEHVEAFRLKLTHPDRPLPADVKSAVSFRVGQQIGTTKWKKARYEDEDDLLQVVLDDLTPRTVDQYLEKQAADAKYAKNPNRNSSEEEEDEDDYGGYYAGYGHAPSTETPKMRKAAESALRGVYTRRVTQQLDSKAEHEVFHNHSRSLYLFSAIYSILPPPRAWRVPNSNFQFFLAVADTQTNTADPDGESRTKKFYHRDQYVPYGLRLNRLSINYHGDLNITADRVSILRDRKVARYHAALSVTANQAFRTQPELAVELALDILTDSHSEGLAHLVKPENEDHNEAYKNAFDIAMRQLHPDIAKDAPIHPSPAGDEKELFEELSLTPISVSPEAWKIMEASGTYVSIEKHARKVLLASPPVPHFHGLDRLRVC